MKRLFSWIIFGFGCFAWTGQVHAQDWTTSGNDAQRSSWIRTDPKISTSTVRHPEFQLLKKFDFHNEPRQMNALTPPALLDFYIGYRGFRSLGFIGGSANNVFVIDTDLSRLEWEKSLSAAPPARGSTVPCPGGMTTHLTRPTSASLPALSGFRGFGRRSPAKGGVGEPNEGALTLTKAGSSGFRFPAKPSTPARRRPPPFPVFRGLSLVYALSGDGMFHTLHVSNGDAHIPPIKFLEPNAHARGLIVVDEVAYVATTNGCGGVADGVWALDLESKKVSHWESNGSVAGVAGPAFSPDGALFAAAAGGEVVKLEPKTLKPAAAYTASGVSFSSSPVVIDYKGKDYLAVASRDGALHLLDGADLSQALDKTPVFAGGEFVPGALSTWEDADGVTWVLTPVDGALAPGVRFPATNGEVTNGAIVAWKLVDQNGSLTLEPGWTSRDMVSPLPPIVVNGVVFAAASGEYRGADASFSSEQRARRSKPAVLYALDGASGKVLWESGDTIKSFATGDGLSSGGSAVYLATYDGALYAFGFPIEH